jgi:DDE superfamily endonuclease
VILNEQEIKPHKVHYYLERHDPEFKQKMTDVLGVYRAISAANSSNLLSFSTPRILHTRRSSLILDNHSVHISKQTNAWLASQRAGRFEVSFTPTHGSWLDLIEGFFSNFEIDLLA